MPGQRAVNRTRDGPSAISRASWTTSRAHSTRRGLARRPPVRCPRIQRSMPDPARFDAAWAEFGERMAVSYPFHHPRYAGQMLKPPHPVAIAAYTAALHVNANNHALDGSPATSAIEVEVMGDLGTMFGCPDDTLGHLTSSGTIANLEALWVARELHPGRRSPSGRRPLHALAHVRRDRRRGLVTDDLEAAAAGARWARSSSPRAPPGSAPSTTSTRRRRAARALRRPRARRRRLRRLLHAARRARPGGSRFRAIAGADSVVVDPHKHGLQPYGCGAVLFRDPGVGRLYKHDSPVHLLHVRRPAPGRDLARVLARGRVRRGAVADAARAGPQADPERRSARRPRLGGAAARASDELRLHASPQLDIVTYFPRRGSLSEIDAATARVLDAGMQRGRTRSTSRRCASAPTPSRRTWSATPTAPGSCAAC